LKLSSALSALRTNARLPVLLPRAICITSPTHGAASVPSALPNMLGNDRPLMD